MCPISSRLLAGLLAASLGAACGVEINARVDGGGGAIDAAAQPEPDAGLGPGLDASSGPQADAGVDPGLDASSGPQADASAGPQADAAAGPGLDASVGPGPDASVVPGADAAANPGLDAASPAPDASVGPFPDAASPGPDAGQAGRDAGAPGRDAGPTTDPIGDLSGDLRTDHIGWRPADPKIAVLLGHAGTAVQLVAMGDNAVAASFSSGAAKTDSSYSGDTYSTVDFSSFTTPGDYYLFLPSGNLRSYPFRIAEDVYDLVGHVAMKSYYFQRCNHDKALPYASDQLDGKGHGSSWVDPACHLGDKAAPAGPGSADHGALDVSGGWHDAGDYQKTLWGRGVPEILFAYEMNPSAWKDGALNIPESGNGISDLLDEARWELDFYVRMQRPDGHFMSSTKGSGGNSYSPPSTSNEGRVYFDCTSPSGNGWSGGGVTLTEATGNAVLSLAHAAVVFRAAGQASLGDGYAAAAAKGWTWLSAQTLSGGENRLKAAAASAVFRMDASNASAKAFADGFPWDTWDGQLPWSATPAEAVMTAGSWHYLLNSAGTASVKAKVRTGVASGVVDRAFQVAGPYGAMFGDAGNTWEWGWGSNRSQGFYGFNLLMAVKQGVLGSKTADEIKARALQHAHYLLGLNPLNMLYLSNMAAYGGEHSSFQLYHGWFSYSGNDGDHGNSKFNGKPAWVVEPMYPYHPLDTQTSTDGPAPGIVPGGPNHAYSCSYDIPKKNWPAYAYRDFSVGCDWSGSACRACSWEITEPMQAYQGPVVAMLSLLMSGK